MTILENGDAVEEPDLAEKGDSAVEKADLTKPIKSVKDKYELLPAFLRVRGLVKQQIDSFNYLVNHEIKKIVRAKDNERVTCDAEPSFYLKFLDVHVGIPQVYDKFELKDISPQQCRLRDLTYSAEVKVDIEFTNGPKVVTARAKDGKGHTLIGRLPIMLRSDRCILKGKSEAELAALGECPLDPGGYFVVKGTEKVVQIQEQLTKNRIILDISSQGLVEASVTSSTHERRSLTRVSNRKGAIVIKSNALTEDLNVAVAMKAMGIESDQEIIQFIGPEAALLPVLLPTLQECKQLEIFTQTQALTYIGSKVKVSKTPFGTIRRRQPPMDEARNVITNLVFSHITVKSFDFKDKALYTALVVRRVLCAMLDPSLIDDRDYYGNKRLELAGGLMALLFEDLFKHMCSELRKDAEKSLGKNRRAEFDISKRIRSDVITGGMESALSSGNWNIKRFRMERKGVSQVLSRLSFMASLGMMTRIQSQFEKSRKVSGPRSLQPSQWGMLCPADTPEGEACGLVKNLAMMTHVTTDEEEAPLCRIAHALGVEPAGLCANADIHTRGCAIVFLNGTILGVHSNPLAFASAIRRLRRAGRIGEFISVYIQQACVYVASDGGRVCRPLIICDQGKPRVNEEHTKKIKSREWTFTHLLRRGLVEYLDVNEENNCLIALYERHCTPTTTHLEIEPFTVLGVVAGLIPYPHHNQSPRNTYQCAMGKQAMGNIAYNQLNRMDTMLYLLAYPQRPLLTTKTIELVGFDKLGAGQNATVAVMSYSGYDIEDAIVMNKASLDRGFGRCIVLRRYACALKKYPNRAQDEVRAPPMKEGEKRGTGRFALLERDGLAAAGEPIRSEDVYVNRFSPLVTRQHGDAAAAAQKPSENSFKPTPMKYKGPVGETCVVDRVLLTEQDEGSGLIVKVQIRHTRRPELGDKFSSRHGQKGVVGNIVAQADMPFSEAGICPDLIMNPHGFPSRMTVGKMIELLGSKAGALSGRFHYGTAFGEEAGLADTVESISETLVKRGFSYSGKDLLTNGTTGEPLEAAIFTGPVYYQKLKHMVVDKIHARATGPRVVLTRQPTEGRARDGGLRLGEMERDCLIGYGASMLLLERLMISSDQFEVHVCTHCGLLGFYDAKSGRPCCPSTKRSDDMQTMKLPYACKLLFQELQSMNIIPRLQLSDT